MKSEPRVALWKCSFCEKDFKYESEKRRHEQSHVPQFECKVCSKKFSFVSALRRHEKQHKRQESVECNTCGRKFKDEALLKRHMQYAHNGKFTCKKCDTTLNSEVALRTHMKIHKPESERKFRCAYNGCSKTFNFIHHLKNHELTHTDDKPHVCMECGKRFIQLHHFRTHQRVHKPESWLPCPVLDCNKEFPNEYALKRHISVAKHKTKSRKLQRNTRKTGEKDKKISENPTDNTFKMNAEQYLNLTLDNSDHLRYISKTDYVQKHEVAIFESDFNITDTASANDAYVRNYEKCYEKITKIVIVNRIDENVEIDDTDCKAVISRCIETGETETNETYLCTEMSTTKKTDEFASDFEIIDTASTKDYAHARNHEKKYNKIMKNIIVNIIDENVEIDGIDFSSSSCKAVIGRCIETGETETNESCLCAQMSTTNKTDGFGSDFEITDMASAEDNAYARNDEQCYSRITKNVMFNRRDENIDINDIDLSLSSCNAVIGKCIETGETQTNKSCLISQISTTNKTGELNTGSPQNNNNTINVNFMDDLKCIDKRRSDVNACETCECANICQIKGVGKNDNMEYETPGLVLRNDGIIKIKEIFDIVDIDVKRNLHKDVTKAKFVAMNSCKDAIGNCIVSGDGTMGEGCLCARMAANDQIISQEIEEITPRPSSSWS